MNYLKIYLKTFNQIFKHSLLKLLCIFELEDNETFLNFDFKGVFANETAQITGKVIDEKYSQKNFSKDPINIGVPKRVLRIEGAMTNEFCSYLKAQFLKPIAK